MRSSLLSLIAAAAAVALASPIASLASKAPTKDVEAANPIVVVLTTRGDIVIELDAKNAPITTANFLRYVDAKKYDGTIFHRVVANFMIQGGGLTSDMKVVKAFDPIRLESDNGLENKRGTVAMARTGAPHSATNQFFINVVNNRHLDYRPGSRPNGYAVFGKVIHGMETVDEIRRIPTQRVGSHPKVPRTEVLIESVQRGTSYSGLEPVSPDDETP